MTMKNFQFYDYNLTLVLDTQVALFPMDSYVPIPRAWDIMNYHHVSRFPRAPLLPHALSILPLNKCY